MLSYSSTVIFCLVVINLLLQSEQPSGTIKDQLAAIAPALEQLWKQRDERVKEFSDVLAQIQKIHGEIDGTLTPKDQCREVDKSDLSSKKLNECKSHLKELQKEKVM